MSCVVLLSSSASREFVPQHAVYDEHEPRIQKAEANLSRPQAAAPADSMANGLLDILRSTGANSRETARNKNEIRDAYCKKFGHSNKEDVPMADVNRKLYELVRAAAIYRIEPEPVRGIFTVRSPSSSKPRFFIVEPSQAP